MYKQILGDGSNMENIFQGQKNGRIERGGIACATTRVNR